MSYSNGLLSDQSYQTANKYVQRGLPGVGFKLTDTGDYDMQNKKLVNVDEGENNQDVVNKHQLDVGLQTKPNKTDVLLLDGTSHMVGDLDLRGNKIILPGEIQMDRKLITNLDTDENQDLSAVNMITLKNKVEPKADKDYVDFEITKQNALINNTFVKKTGDQMNGDLILPHDSYPVDGNTNKAISYETQREIFLSRRESFPMQADINMNNNFIQNIATPTSSHQVTNKGYCDYNFLNRQKGGVLMGPLSMNRNDLTGIPDTPKFGYSAVNKNYVDGEITKIDTTQFVKKVGDTMTGVLNMNGNTIKNIKLDDKDDTSTVPLSEIKKNFTTVIGELTRIDNTFLKKDGTISMTGNLDMNIHKIENLNAPSNLTDAANKQYIDEKLLKSHLISSEIENAFKYLSDQDESSSERNIVVHGITIFNGSPHKKNKKAYNADLIYTTGLQYYDSKIGINLYSLPIGKYTVIMEYYFSEDINIKIYIEATHALINNHQLTNFPNYKKILVQINRQSKIPDYLFFTITGNGTTSTNPEVYLIFYGIKGWVNNIPQEIYDHTLETGMFEYDNGNMKIYHNIDMDNNKIINLDGGIDNNDAVNMEQFNSIKTRFDEQVPYMKNNIYMTIFTYRFFDFNATIKYKFSKQQRYHAIIGIEPDLSFSSTNGSHLTKDELIYKKGLQFNNSMHIIIDLGYLVDHNMPYTMMMSLTLKDNLQIYFVEPTQEQIAYNPIYEIQKSSSQLIIKSAGNVITQTIYSSRYNDQQCLLWIEYSNQTNTHTISLPGYTNAHHVPIPAPFSTRKLRIDPGNNIIKKFGYQNQLINSYDDYFKISLEDKNNGTII